jgi:hypothetical protein
MADTSSVKIRVHWWLDFSPAWIALLCVCFLFADSAIAQKVSRGTSTSGNRTSGPKVSKGASSPDPAKAPVKTVTRTEYKTVSVEPNKGDLVLVAVSQASVTLTRAGAKQAEKFNIEADNVTLTRNALTPGTYNIAVAHPDYEAFNAQVIIRKGVTTTVEADLVSRFGSIVLTGIPANAKLSLDQQPLSTERYKIENKNVIISRVPVGAHSLKITLEGYDDFIRDNITVTPGNASVIPAEISLPTVRLMLTTQPGARVYADNEEKGTTQPDGSISVSLPPGKHTIRLYKEGYEDWKKEFTLTLKNKTVNERVELAPTVVSVEGDWLPVIGARKWFPNPAPWQFDKTGARISGDQVFLFDTERDKDFNFYRNFRLEFDAKFANGKGLAWIVRAKDRNNYYLFELNGPGSSEPNTFKFYVCREGQLEELDSKPVIEKIDAPGESFHFIFEARGDRFETRIAISSQPRPEAQPLAIFTDRTFNGGGVGFRSKEDKQMLLNFFVITPI